MRVTLLSLALLFFFLSQSSGQAPGIEWQKCLGGINYESAFTIKQTKDDGYVLAAYAEYDNGDVSGTIGGGDAWIVKLNSAGGIQWQKCLGGTKAEANRAVGIDQTNDGGYVVTTETKSNDIDVLGNHGSYDGWVVKLDSAGNINWQRCLGGTGDEELRSIQQTSDSGYIVAGLTSTNNNGDVSGNHGGGDYWIVKLDSLGNMQWQKCLGGSATDEANSIQQTKDGGYVVTGYTTSEDGDVTGLHSSGDYWVVKLDPQGNIQWQKCLGGQNADLAESIKQTMDGGYIVAGYSNSIDGDISGNHGTWDYWVVKIDSLGSIEWQKSLGGPLEDYGYDVVQTIDSCYVVTGFSDSFTGDVTGNHGFDDEWLVKLTPQGVIKWRKCFGGTNDEYSLSLCATPDGGVVTSAFTASNDDDVSGNHGNLDCWVVKLSGTTPVIDPDFSNTSLNIYPNPFSSSTSIDISLGANTYTIIDLFDVAERKLQNVLQESLAGGNHKIPLNRNQLPSGIYFLQSLIGDKTIITKIVIE